MKTILIILLTSVFLMQSCTEDPVVQGDRKVTYRVSGTEYNVLIKYPNGEKELVYNQTNVFKRYAHASNGDPLYVLAYGSDDLIVTISVDGKLDTIRKSANTGTTVVLVETMVKAD